MIAHYSNSEPFNKEHFKNIFDNLVRQKICDRSEEDEFYESIELIKNISSQLQ